MKQTKTLDRGENPVYIIFFSHIFRPFLGH